MCETCSAVTIDLTGSSESATSIVSENKGIISLVTQDSEES